MSRDSCIQEFHERLKAIVLGRLVIKNSNYNHWWLEHIIIGGSNARGSKWLHPVAGFSRFAPVRRRSRIFANWLLLFVEPVLRQFLIFSERDTKISANVVLGRFPMGRCPMGITLACNYYSWLGYRKSAWLGSGSRNDRSPIEQQWGGSEARSRKGKTMANTQFILLRDCLIINLF